MAKTLFYERKNMIGTTNASGGGITSDEATTTKDKVLAGTTYLGADTDDEVGVGTMPDNPAQNATLNCGESHIIPAGYTPGGKIIANSLASQTPGDATASHILSGKTAWVNGGMVSGGITSLGAQTITPKTSFQTIPCSGKYMTGDIAVKAVVPPPANKLAKGYVYMGVTGTMEQIIIQSPLTTWKGTNEYKFGFLSRPIMIHSGSYSGRLDYWIGSTGMDSNLSASGSGGTGSNWGEALYRFSNAVNLTGYTTARIKVTLSTTGNGAPSTAFGFSTASYLTGPYYQASYTTTDQNVSYINYDINVSSLNGNYYMYMYQYIPLLTGSRQNCKYRISVYDITLI